MNVLWIMTDEHNASCIPGGRSELRAPNLERLERSGITFTRAYANSPICGPSRMSFITGTHPHTHGMIGNLCFDLPGPVPKTLPLAFRRAGYQTALAGKSHSVGSWDDAAYELIRYSDIIDSPAGAPQANHYFAHLIEHGLADDFDLGVHDGYDFRPFVSRIPREHSLERWTGDRAVEFLRSRDSSRPFFLNLSFQRPHDPLSLCADEELLYDPDDLTLPESARDWFEHGFSGHHTLVRNRLQSGATAFPLVPTSEHDLRTALAHYYHLITRIDEEIGRVLDELDRAGDLDDTIVVFTSDHGDFAGEHGLMIKGLGIYESIQRIPLIVSLPAGPAGVESDAVVESVDLFPTLCSLCGIETPEPVEGRAILGPAADGKKHAFCESWGEGDARALSVVTERYRLTYYPEARSGELFDHDHDPGETRSVFDEGSYASVRDKLLRRLLSFSCEAQPRRANDLAESARIAGADTPKMLIHKQRATWSEVASDR